MHSFKSVMNFVLNGLEDLVFTISAILIIVLASLVSAEIILRNLGYSMVITEEICFIFLGWTAFLAASYTFRKRGHVSVDFFYGKMSMKWRKILYAATYIGTIVFLAFIVYKGWGIAMRQMKIPLTQSRLPRGLIFWGLPVGCSISIVFLVGDLIETFLFGNDASLTTQEERQLKEIEDNRADAAAMARDLMGMEGN